MERYQRQILFEKLGTGGQDKLLASKVLIVGMGALGSMCASLLARTGVGYIRMIDKDTVDISNLHRQILYIEEDVNKGLSKVKAAKKHLEEINSGITTDAVDAYLDESNIDEVFKDMDLVLDAVDNMKTRYLINRYCTAHRIPWIYAGANGSEGMTADFLPGGPCFACFTGNRDGYEESSFRDTKTHGIIGMLPAIMASYEVTEAIKILTDSGDVRKTMMYIDIWENITEYLEIKKDPYCPVCGGKTDEI